MRNYIPLQCSVVNFYSINFFRPLFCVGFKVEYDEIRYVLLEKEFIIRYLIEPRSK